MTRDKEKKLDWRDAAGIVQFPDDMPPEKWVRGLRETRDDAIREVVDVAEDVVANASPKATQPGHALVSIVDLQRLSDALKAYWHKEEEE